MSVTHITFLYGPNNAFYRLIFLSIWPSIEVCIECVARECFDVTGYADEVLAVDRAIQSAQSTMKSNPSACRRRKGERQPAPCTASGRYGNISVIDGAADNRQNG